ncbi:DNA replication ATP-dependent helicase/nuclease DNA2 [Diabrotica virgifera virgifera]|uniref:DNA replication ATP-dependent helicase/nuclease n=1 Tax=Diabrotica virgifera virgifera TaxID=50390 RepID=A0ABM5IGA4_DIAVI|nr:DNA replication ATP-dependent helicase/nuclease DNA2 [Diabrotica virgifera virgifera]
MNKPPRTKVKTPPKNNLKISQFFFKDRTNLKTNGTKEDNSEQSTNMALIDGAKSNKAGKTVNTNNDSMQSMGTLHNNKKRKSSEDEVDKECKKLCHEEEISCFKGHNVDESLDVTDCSILNQVPIDRLSSPEKLIKVKSPMKQKIEKENKTKQISLVKKEITQMDSFPDMCEVDFDDWEENTVIEPENFNLDLTQPCHCKITQIVTSGHTISLHLLSTKESKEAVCEVQGIWTYSNLSIGDTIYITCAKVNNTWVVNNDWGLIVFEPDILVSSTSVVGSLWCKRRNVLAERFRGFDSTNQYMILGTLIHSTLQHALKYNVSETEKLEGLVRKFMSKSRVVKNLYECDISADWINDEVVKYIPRIQEFMNVYVNKGNNQIQIKDNWKGRIDDIEDVEENIWCPELGIKGKIDVTVQVNNKPMPLELKTGKTSLSLEHRGQVMLYLMMMNKIGYNASSGLLLYIKEGVVKEISHTKKEERDLIYLRNELVYYLTQSVTEADNILIPPSLPEPINHKSCTNCPYSAICTVYAHVNNESLSSKPTLKSIQDEILQNLKQSHIDYFMKWTSLLLIEAESNKGAKDIKEIYLVPPSDREKKGRCISNLRISKVSDVIDELYFEHYFERMVPDSSGNFGTSGLLVGGYVVVSTDKRHAVAAGFVNDITATSISVTLERNLTLKFKNQTFYIDSYDSGMLQSFNLSSLALLLEPTPRAENLRKIIVDKESPTFRTTLPKVVGTTGKTILRRLNRVQQRAVLKAITANEYFLIKGMPGTGKTATIVALIQLLYELGKTVLITSHTNSAVDNVCLKLLEHGVKFIRLGSESKIHKDLHEYSEHSLTKNCSTASDYEAVYNSAQIIAVTCFASGHPVLTKRCLDICIVDESTQVLQPSVIRPLYACKTFILIGDPDQLPAVIKSSKARELGMSESLFERLYATDAATSLNINYRMNKTITALANHLTYNGELQVGNSSIENATISFPNKQVLTDSYSGDSWILKALDESLDSAVQFLDTGPVWNLEQDTSWKIHKSFSTEDTSSKVNIHEAAIIFKLVKALLKAGLPAKDIGVIASYRHQVEQLSTLLKSECIDINTVDQFQGKDKSVIIYSCGNSKNTDTFKVSKNDDILEDKRRLTVAITRAKHKLIIVGDVKTLMVYSTFKKLLSNFSNNVIKLCESRDFSWEQCLLLNES